MKPSPIFCAPDRYVGEWIQLNHGPAHQVVLHVDEVRLTACGRVLRSWDPAQPGQDGCVVCVKSARFQEFAE